MTMVFVFGSNLAGRHGAGAAKAARMHYGAPYGKGLGRISMACYAIPTKDENIQTLPLDIIEWYVNQFVGHAAMHPNDHFVVTRIGCGLAGYKDEQIAPLFKNSPNNCYFPAKWGKLIQNE